MNVYRLYSNPGGRLDYVLADSIEKAILILKRKKNNQEFKILQIETVATDVIYETDEYKFRIAAKSIKEDLIQIVSEDIKEYLDNREL